jgi:RHS repeat-associated protein
LTNRWTPAKGDTGYGYDALGNRTSINYGGTSSILFGYDTLNRMTNMVDGLGTNRFTYNAAGQLLTVGGLWSGDTVTYTYINRLRNSLAVGSWSQTYGYDRALRLTNVTSPAGSFAFGYDVTRRQHVASLQLPNSAYITNSYDIMARLAGTYLTRGTDNHVLDGYTYAYDQLGQRTNILRDYGLTTSTASAGYDAIGQLTSWQAKEAGGAARLQEQLGYAYDAAGNLKQRTNNALVQVYGVDAANALTNITRSGPLTVSGNTPAPASSVTVNGQPAYTYRDFTFASSNAFSLADGQNLFTNVARNYYGTNSVTNLLNVNLPATVTLQLDANGNLTNDGLRVFSYDTENQLTNVLVTGQWQQSFLYDGLNRRRVVRDYVWQGGVWALTNEMRYIYDGASVIQEWNSNNTAQVSYARAGAGLLARTDSGGAVYYHADGNGNITALIDTNQYMVGRYLYDPFGRMLGKWGPHADANTYRFAGKEWSERTGLYYFARRFYDPNLQRFINRDPISENGGQNLYAYCGNNPISLYDMMGLCPRSIGDTLLGWYENAVLATGLYATGLSTEQDALQKMYGLYDKYGASGYMDENGVWNTSVMIGGEYVGTTPFAEGVNGVDIGYGTQLSGLESWVRGTSGAISMVGTVFAGDGAGGGLEAAEGGTASAQPWIFKAGTPDSVIDQATADAIARLDKVTSENGTTFGWGGASKTGDNLGWTSWQHNTVSLFDGADVTTLMEEAHHAETAAKWGYLGDVPESAAQAASRNAALEAAWEEYASSIGLVKKH